MKKINFLGLLSLVFTLSGCTYSINMVHTQGEATDVVDETQTPSAKVDPNINVPLSGL